MNLFATTCSTPFGPFSIAVNDGAAVVATAFGDASALHVRLHRYPPINDSGATRVAREQILEYFAGERQTFDLELAPSGTAFQLQVWTALQTIPCGETRSYGQIATHLGRPTAARAVGRANATNPLCLIVPCHRVIGADGSLTGFAFGEDLKRRLLAHERMAISCPA